MEIERASVLARIDRHKRYKIKLSPKGMKVFFTLNKEEARRYFSSDVAGDPTTFGVDVSKEDRTIYIRGYQ